MHKEFDRETYSKMFNWKTKEMGR